MDFIPKRAMLWHVVETRALLRGMPYAVTMELEIYLRRGIEALLVEAEMRGYKKTQDRIPKSQILEPDGEISIESESEDL